MAKRKSGKKGAKKAKDPVGAYGIAEWYGRLYRTLDDHTRKELVAFPSVECRFLADAPDLAPRSKTLCNKKGGVCSIRNFVSAPDGDGGFRFGSITATCPNRFLEGQLIFATIAKVILETEKPLIVKEI